jgi:ribosomal protein S27E
LVFGLWIDHPALAARNSSMPLIVRCTSCHHDGVVPDDLRNDRATEINCRHCGKPLPLRPVERASKSGGNSPGAIIAFIMGACSLFFAFGGELALRRALGEDSSRLTPTRSSFPRSWL